MFLVGVFILRVGVSISWACLFVLAGQYVSNPVSRCLDGIFRHDVSPGPSLVGGVGANDHSRYVDDIGMCCVLIARSNRPVAETLLIRFPSFLLGRFEEI